MEAPKPISLLTPAKPENNITLLDKKEFKITNEKVEYIVEIGKLSSTENLGIKLKENTSSTKVYYSNVFNLEELRNIHKSFRVFDNINPLASPSAGTPALKYGYVNIVTTSPGEVKGLILFQKKCFYIKICFFFYHL